MSAITAELVAKASVAYDAVTVLDGGNLVYWLEGRPDGSDALVSWTPQTGVRDVLPGGPSVASYVHEYGGGAYLATDTGIWFCNADDQRLYHATGDHIIPLTRAPNVPGSVRYADMRLNPDRHGLWAVRERHEPDAVINELVWLPATGGETRVVASGWDFYSYPRPSPDGRWLAWTCWNAPLMPWDGTWLHLAEILAPGQLGEPIVVAGGPEESVFQPEWSPDGVLHLVSDRSGWWNLYAWRDNRLSPVWTPESELGVAQWEFGYSTYAFLDHGRIAVLAHNGGQQYLHILQEGTTRHVDLPFTSIKPYLSASNTTAAIIAASPTQAPQVVLVDLDTGRHRTLAAPNTSTSTLSWPRAFTFPTRDGARAHGWYHPPAEDRRQPPLIVKAHPGPTASTPLRLDWHTQYFTSRGYAVAEIDYRGSTGYGRRYRQALHGQWGVLDALDCADAAAYLIATGHADRQRTAIWGASAGGYTALRAIALTDIFTAAIAHSPVIEPTTWRNAAPKFQAHHTDSLIGPPAQAKETYRQRSLLQHPENINRPILLIHGDNDPITPPEQSHLLAQTLGHQAHLLSFRNEGHTLRTPDSIQQALQAELDFLTNPPR
ncbi:S9 family peptidase [Actinomadura sp. SCN-SB]|uniref:S9 family peptidase n=1 Tax=Actinomadura sp. SCN-SB TaxID=3373092 RepID=UPI00375330EE